MLSHTTICNIPECLFLAEDCLLPLPDEGLLTRKQSLKLDESAAIADPFRTLAVQCLRQVGTSEQEENC